MRSAESRLEIVLSPDLKTGRVTGPSHVRVTKEIVELQWVLHLPRLHAAFENVELFLSSEKRRRVYPDFFNHEGGTYGWNCGNPEVGRWCLSFNKVEVPETLLLHYTMVFSLGMLHDDSWDPTLEIDPRGIGIPPGR